MAENEKNAVERGFVRNGGIRRDMDRWKENGEK
jgi:hypothetical protein